MDYEIPTCPEHGPKVPFGTRTGFDTRYGFRKPVDIVVYRCPTCTPTNDEIAKRLESIEKALGIR